MLSFKKVENSLKCALSIQQAFAEHAIKHPEQAMQIRIGLCAGEPVEENNDLFGTSVQLAARACDAASPGQILAVQSVKENYHSEHPRFISTTKRNFKGFSEPVKVYEIPWH